MVFRNSEKQSINIQDQTQTKVITPITIEIVHIQTPEIDIIQMTVLEIPHIIETETIQTKRNRKYPNNRSRNHSNKRSNYNSYHNRSRDNSNNRNSKNSNRLRNCS